MSSINSNQPFNSSSVLPQTDAMRAKDEVICRCLAITRSEIDDAIQYDDAETISDIRQTTRAGSGCNACHHKIRCMLANR